MEREGTAPCRVGYNFVGLSAIPSLSFSAGRFPLPSLSPQVLVSGCIRLRCLNKTTNCWASTTEMRFLEISTLHIEDQRANRAVVLLSSLLDVSQWSLQKDARLTGLEATLMTSFQPEELFTRPVSKYSRVLRTQGEGFICVNSGHTQSNL